MRRSSVSQLCGEDGGSQGLTCSLDSVKDPSSFSPPPHSFQLPGIAFEFGDGDFHLNPKGVQAGGPLQKDRIPLLTSVVEMGNGHTGCYLVSGLGKAPHYQVPVKGDGPSQCETAAKGHNLKYTFLPTSTDHKLQGRMVVWNEGGEHFHSVLPIISGLPFNRFLRDYLVGTTSKRKARNQQPTQSIRGAVTFNFGFATQNLKVPLGEMVAAPAVIQGTDETIYGIMSAMTQLSNKMSEEDSSLSFQNPTRQQRFAQSLSADTTSKATNNIEALTVGITKFGINDQPKDNQTFGCHIDSTNDPKQDVTVCAYRCFQHEQFVYRVSFLGYSRNSIGYFLDREKRVQSYVANLNSYIRFERSREWHDPSTLLVSTPTRIRPSLDRLGMLSCAIDGVKKIHRAWGGLRWEEVLELLIPIAFCDVVEDVAQVYVELSSLSSNPTKTHHNTDTQPGGLLAIHIIHEVVRKFGALGVGKGRGGFGFLRTNTTRGYIIRLLQTTESAFRLAHNNPSLLYKDILYSITRGQNPRLQSGFQHMITVAAAIGLVPQSNVGCSEFIRETRTARAVSSEIGNSATALQTLFSTVADDNNMPISTVANANDEFVAIFKPSQYVFKDTYERAIGPEDRLDTILPGQSLFRVRLLLNDQSVVIEECSHRSDWAPFEGLGTRLPSIESVSEWLPVSLTNDDTVVHVVQGTSQEAVVDDGGEEGPTDTVPTEHNDDDQHEDNNDEHMVADVTPDGRRELCLAYPTHSWSRQDAISRKEPAKMLSKVLPAYLEVVASSPQKGNVLWFDPGLEALGVMSTNKKLWHREPNHHDFKKRKRTTYFKTICETPVPGTKHWSCRIDAEARVFVNANETLTTLTGWVPGYVQNNQRWYRTKAQAKRAAATTVLLKAMKRRDTEGHPYWASRLLSPYTTTEGDFRILVENLPNKQYRTYGILVYKFGTHHLILPMASNSFYSHVEHFILNEKGVAVKVLNS